MGISWIPRGECSCGDSVDAVTLILINVMSNSKYTVPPKLSGQGFTVVASVRVEPVEVVLLMIVRAALMVLMSCTWDPGGTSRFLTVPTVVIGIADVVSMFGAVVNYLVPFVSFAVFLHVAWFG